MRRIKIKLKDFSRQNVDAVVDEIKKGGVIVAPSDTIYGFSCDATDDHAVKKLYSIKKMSREKTSLVLMKSFCMIRKYCFLSQKQYEYIKKTLEKSRPITVILRSRGNLGEHFTSPSLGIAVRIPKKSEFLMKVLKRADTPLASTSLNVTGSEPIDEVSDLAGFFKKNPPDLVVDAGKISRIKSSKIVDIRNMDDIKVLRG
ncbi:MAG: L-threonylcarbamoyladenylate synthase [Candidatus Moranbacteria bacterium]|nr:L-threonylcarbamoyladenylate synthase [Candidatus Moranbacteria bacterium]